MVAALGIAGDRTRGGMWLERCAAAMRLVGPCLLVGVIALAACRPPGWDKRDPGGDVDAAVGPDGGGPDAALDASLTCMKDFRLDGRTTATSVYLTGTFNSWAANPPAAIAFTQGADGGWTATHTFSPGLHQYKFIVNGNEWIADPTNPDGIDDGFGGRNSLYTCVP